MRRPIDYDYAPVLVAPDQQKIVAAIEDTATQGFVVRDTEPIRVELAASSIGFRAADPVQFVRPAGLSEAVSHLQSGLSIEGSSWTKYGITPIHRDGVEDDSMISVCEGVRGSFEILVFTPGTRYREMSNSRRNQEATGHVLNSNTIDPQFLSPRVTRLRAEPSDILVFNPTKPHMGVTHQGPRLSLTTLFQR